MLDSLNTTLVLLHGKKLNLDQSFLDLDLTFVTLLYGNIVLQQ